MALYSGLLLSTLKQFLEKVFGHLKKKKNYRKIIGT